MPSEEENRRAVFPLEQSSFVRRQALCDQVIQALSKKREEMTNKDIAVLRMAEEELARVLAGGDSGLANLADYGSYVEAKGSYYILMFESGKALKEDIRKKDLREVFSSYRENIRRLRTGEEVEKPVLEEVKGFFEVTLETLKKAGEYSKQL